MPVAEKDVSSESAFYIHASNVPWSVCQKHVREHFDRLCIPKGGICVRGSNAFILFGDQSSTAKALLKDLSVLQGNVIRVRVISKKALQDALFQHCRRVLNFGGRNVPTSKRIRPTRIVEASHELHRIPEVFKVFEVERPMSAPPQISCEKQTTKPSKGKRKIHPTSVVETGDSKLDIFHPEECHLKEIKKLRLELISA